MSAAVRSGAPATAAGTKTVLVVDDEEMVRRLVARMLVDRGYRVLVASDADEALDILRRTALRTRIVVTDLRMPGLNGRQLADTVLACWPHVRILFMSGYPADRLMNEGALLDGRPFIQKPFTGEQLVLRVRQLLADPADQ